MTESDTDHYEPNQPAVPERIGPYRLIEKIGEGGMGVVYAAEQREPVRRRVALKVIKLGMDTEEVLARFEAEHHALSLMDHPGIARVLDAGATPDGRPYFVMEFVRGTTLTAFCDRERNSTRERLDLFMAICFAMQHAHQKGVIHRDLKPSNILVTLQDGKPVPKIIDFGVAKATAQRLTEQTLYTQLGALIGTPMYMSPEQADPSGVDIDTRSDVYSLGTILYELLAGALPFDSNTLQAAGYAEFQRIIREVDPPRPSTRVGTGAESESAASRRHTDPRTLMRRLRGDLDWITMKALEKNRTRRYASASELAEDIGRHLRDEPVVAGPPSAAYRIRKFVARNRVQVAAAAVMLALLAIGVIGITTQYFRAERNATNERTERVRADEALHRFHLLGISVRIDDALATEGDLFPAWPSTERALVDWLDRHAYPLRDELSTLTAVRNELRGRAGVYTTEQRDQDLETHPDAAELRALRERVTGMQRAIEGYQAGPRKPLRLDQMKTQSEQAEALLASLEAKVRQRRTYEFDADQDRFLHDALTGIVTELEQFVGPHGALANAERRLSWARKINTLTIENHAPAWQRALAAIAASARYAAAPPLNPQTGLTPIGENPATGNWEFYHLRSGTPDHAIPAHEPDGKITMTGDTGIVFVLLPGGTFWQGADSRPDGHNYDPGANAGEYDDNGRAVSVRLSPFFMSRYETGTVAAPERGLE